MTRLKERSQSVPGLRYMGDMHKVSNCCSAPQSCQEALQVRTREETPPAWASDEIPASSSLLKPAGSMTEDSEHLEGSAEASARRLRSISPMASRAHIADYRAQSDEGGRHAARASRPPGCASIGKMRLTSNARSVWRLCRTARQVPNYSQYCQRRRPPFRFANDAFYLTFQTSDIALGETICLGAAIDQLHHPGWPPLLKREHVMQSWRSILANPNAAGAGDAPLLRYHGAYCSPARLLGSSRWSRPTPRAKTDRKGNCPLPVGETPPPEANLTKPERTLQ